MNNVTLLGRLVRDLELKSYQGANTGVIARFTLAVDRGLSKEKKEQAEKNNTPTVDFINCIAYNKTAELIDKFVGKGNRLSVNGKIQTGSYQTKDGQTRYTTDVLVNNVTLIDFKEQGNINQSNRFNADFEEVQDARIPF